MFGGETMKRLFEKLKKPKTGERGAVVVEATICLSAFVFALFLILSVVDICYVQAKIGIALNSAAKEMSQYAYLYDALDLYDNMSGQGGKSSELMKGFTGFFDKLSDGTGNISEQLSSTFSKSAELTENESGAEYMKNGGGMLLAQQCVKKNLKSHPNDSADAFLKRCHVEDGFKGLNFLNSTFLTDANQSEVNLVVAYKVQVVRLMGIDYTFNFVQRASTKAWGRGASGQPEAPASSSVWDMSNQFARGNAIVATEKKKYTYTSSTNGYHAYDAKNNQFIKIRSMDTFADTYSGNAKEIEKAIKQSYTEMQSGVSKLEKNIVMQNASGKDVTVASNTSTRTYKVVLVVPDSYDKESVQEAVNNFKSKNPGVSVEIKTGYGDPADAKKEDTEEK